MGTGQYALVDMGVMISFQIREIETKEKLLCIINLTFLILRAPVFLFRLLDNTFNQETVKHSIGH